MDITIALLKYAYKQYYNIDIDDNKLNVRNYHSQKEYGGLYFAHSLSDNMVIVAIGNSPVSIGASSRPLDDDWKASDELLHVNEYKEYEQSGYSPETLCWIWSKKNAFRKLHNIEPPSDADPFDCSFQKNIDGTLGQYTLHHFNYNNRYAQYLAVTGKAEFKEVPIETVFKPNW